MLAFKDLKVGMCFDSRDHTHTLHIIKITEALVTYSSGQTTFKSELSPDLFIEGLTLGGWKLKDTPIINPHMSHDIHCNHTNIQEDRYFSARVYKTCKDCNKALN